MVRYTLKNKPLPTRYTYKNDITLEKYLEGGGIIDFFRHRRMMYEFDNVMNSIRKANNKLKKYEEPLEDFRKRYEHYDQKIVSYLDEYFAGLRLLQLFEFQLKDIKKDPSKKLHEANVNANIAKIKLKLKILEKDYNLQFDKNNLNDMKSLVKIGKKIDKKLNKFKKEFEKVSNFREKYSKDIAEGELYDATSETAATKESKKLKKKVTTYKKDYEKLNKLSASNFDDLTKIQQDVINLRENITNLQNNIKGMKDKKVEHTKMIEKWKKQGNDFYLSLTKFEKNNMLKLAKEIKVKLDGIRRLYYTVANPTIQSKVVDKFTKLETDAESVLQILTSVKSEMNRIKSNFLNRASAAELNADSSHLIKGVNRAIEMLNDIDYFIEQYQTEGGWQHFFGVNKVMTGGATPLENMIDVVFGTKNTKGGLLQEWSNDKNNDTVKKQITQKFYTELKNNMKIDLTQDTTWFSFYKRKPKQKHSYEVYDFKKGLKLKYEINLKKISGFNEKLAMLIPTTKPSYYIFYPGTQYKSKKGTLTDMQDKYLEKLYFVKVFHISQNKYKLLFIDHKTGLPIVVYKKNPDKCQRNKDIFASLIDKDPNSTIHKAFVDVFLINKENKTEANDQSKRRGNTCNIARGLIQVFDNVFDTSLNTNPYTRIHMDLIDLYEGKLDFANVDNFIQTQQNVTAQNKKLQLMYIPVSSDNTKIIKALSSNPDTITMEATESLNSSAITGMVNRQAGEKFRRLEELLGENYANVQNLQTELRELISTFMKSYAIDSLESDNAQKVINKVAKYLNDLQTTEGKFIKYKQGESIQSSISGWDLKETMTADKINTDNSVSKELKDKLESTYSSKIAGDLRVYQQSDPTLYLEMILTSKNPQNLISIKKELIEYLNQTGVVRNMLDTPLKVNDKNTGKRTEVINDKLYDQMAMIVGYNNTVITLGNTKEDRDLFISLTNRYQDIKNKSKNTSGKGTGTGTGTGTGSGSGSGTGTSTGTSS